MNVEGEDEVIDTEEVEAVVEREYDDRPDFELDEVEISEIEDDQVYFAMLSDSQNTSMKIHENDKEPKSYSEALSGANSNEWKNAVRDAYQAHFKNETWVLPY